MTPLPEAFLAAPIAHRALHDRAAGRVENSLSAIRAAAERGYGIEVDVQLAADGAAMVFHDDTLDRLTGARGAVRARTAGELVRIPLRGSDDRIPTLDAALSEIAGRVPLLIEIKDQDGRLGENIGALEAAVARALAGYAGPVAVMSFNPDAVAAMARLAPEVPRGLVTDPFSRAHWPRVPSARRATLREIRDFQRVGAGFVSHRAADLDAPPVAALKAAGVPVLCWTIRSPAEERAARRVADNVTFEGYEPRVGAS